MTATRSMRGKHTASNGLVSQVRTAGRAAQDAKHRHVRRNTASQAGHGTEGSDEALPDRPPRSLTATTKAERRKGIGRAVFRRYRKTLP